MVDTAHGPLHIQAVIAAAIQLGVKYAPNQLRLVEVAAAHHDIGRAVDDENHEQVGADLLAFSPEFEDLRSQFSKEDWVVVLDAVRQHRASNGKPETVVARIISDADRLGQPEQMGPLKRAYLYRLERGMEHRSSLVQAAAYLYEKYRGPRLRVYFPETRAMMEKSHAPIFAAYERQDWAALERMLD